MKRSKIDFNVALFTKMFINWSLYYFLLKLGGKVMKCYCASIICGWHGWKKTTVSCFSFLFSRRVTMASIVFHLLIYTTRVRRFQQKWNRKPNRNRPFGTGTEPEPIFFNFLKPEPNRTGTVFFLVSWNRNRTGTVKSHFK
jgi:hypothetical protein